jgi:S1-C subfamily serine protease
VDARGVYYRGDTVGSLTQVSWCGAGINTAIYSPSGANSGVGFAIPVDVVKSSVSQIIQYGKVIRPILGIQFAPDQTEQVGGPLSVFEHEYKSYLHGMYACINAHA